MSAILDAKRLGGRPDILRGKIGFIGAGKVGTALSALLHARGADVVAVSGRTQTDSERMARQASLDPQIAMSRADTVASSDIVFLTVPDDAIAPLCREIADEGGWLEGQGVVHCSGALPSTILQPAGDAGALIASFHPLQAFASTQAALEHLPGATFALEGDARLMAKLDEIVQLLGGTALHITAEQKTVYHAAAVIASNYTVTLAALAAELLTQEGIAPDPNTALHYLMPLVRGTVDNLEALGLPDALTGPLARGDAGTIASHLHALQDRSPEIAALYRQLARLTLPLAEQKGHLSEQTVRELDRILRDEK